VLFGASATAAPWQLSKPDQSAVRGYASDISVAQGAALGISLSGRDPWADLDVYRMGLDDARLVARVRHVAIPTGEVDSPPRPSDGLVADDWPVAYRLPIDAAWSSGVYLIKLTGASGGQSYVLFLVRPTQPGPLTVVLPTMTYEAYNDQGGADLYGWFGRSHARAWAVSFDRPFRGQFGAGLFFRLDFPLIVWLEDHGYHPDYVADVDIARQPSLLTDVRTLVFAGHSEYWTGGMRDAVDAAARSGTNLAFFGANQAFWQARLTDDAAATPDRVMICYKSADLDPITASDPSAATARFEQAPVNRPPSQLLGEKYGGIVAGVSAMQIGPGIATFAPGIGLHEGQVLPGLIGEEVDELHPAFHGIALGQTPMQVEEHPGSILVGTTLWINPMGDRVFDAGTFDYAWGLDPRYAAALPGFDAPAFSELTARILAWLGAVTR
jgi:hypothetical protein